MSLNTSTVLFHICKISPWSLRRGKPFPAFLSSFLLGTRGGPCATQQPLQALLAVLFVSKFFHFVSKVFYFIFPIKLIVQFSPPSQSCSTLSSFSPLIPISPFISKFYTFFPSFTPYFLVLHFLSFPFFISKSSTLFPRFCTFYFQGSFYFSFFSSFKFPPFTSTFLHFVSQFSAPFPRFSPRLLRVCQHENPGETL